MTTYQIGDRVFKDDDASLRGTILKIYFTNFKCIPNYQACYVLWDNLNKVEFESGDNLYSESLIGKAIPNPDLEARVEKLEKLVEKFSHCGY